jgi:hypothetical protein
MSRSRLGQQGRFYMRLSADVPMERARTVKTVVQLFGLPQKLGILQTVSFSEDDAYRARYRGILIAQGCKKRRLYQV